MSDAIKTILPIAFWKTRSFWLGIVPTVASAMDLAFYYLAGESSGPIAAALAEVIRIFGPDITGGQITDFMQKLYPLYFLIFAQQRGTFSGAIPRPYTGAAKNEQIVRDVVRDGKVVLEAAKEMGLVRR